MHNTLPFEANLNWVNRSPMRLPVKVNKRAEEAISEFLLEDHQENEQSELTQAILSIEDFEEDII